LSLGILFLPALQSIQRIEKMGTKLYVGNLSFRTTSEELREAFAAVGTVESASVIEDRDTGRSRGFAFVEMTTPEAAAAAIEQFNGKDFGGRNLTVNEAKPRTDRGGGRGYGGSGGRGGYGGGGDGGDRGGDRGGYEREPRW
jgi:RNA recognition motif-containing protein